MPPVQSPKTEPPTRPSATDEPRSRTSPPAQSAASDAAIDIHWNAAATRALTELGQNKRDLNLVVRQAVKRALRDAKSLYPALQTQLQTIESPQWELDIAFTDDVSIQSLNDEHRGKNKPTDVLSFPVWEGDFVFPLPPGETQIMLGDMVISIETAARQAAELKHDLRAELAFLAVHGTLHLLGYDHATDNQRRKMFALQDEIVAQLREEKGF